MFEPFRMEKHSSMVSVGRGAHYASKFELSDLTNQTLTSTNAALWHFRSMVHAMGYSPHIGFIPPVARYLYDLADLYKEHLCIDLAFGANEGYGGSV